MKVILLIAVGGAIGALLRYWISSGVFALTGGHLFPSGILTVNVLGSLIIGFAAMAITSSLTYDVEIRAFVIIGFLGALTTFSSFSLDTVTLVEKGHWGYALTNIFLNMILCFGATALGLWLGTLASK